MAMRHKAVRLANLALAAISVSFACGSVLADATVPAASGNDPAIHGTFNAGADLTRPANRFDLRERYERLPEAKGLQPEKWVTTLRADLWSGFAGGWTLYGRVDQPLVYSNDVTSPFNPDGHSRFGQGDLLTELAIVPPPPSARFAYGLGMRAVWPTGSLNEAGDGKYQIGPAAGARVSLPEISPGSAFILQTYYLNSVASRNENKGQADINQLNIQPKFHVVLPDEWFLTTYASESIQKNYGDGGKWFVPFDLMVGRKLFDKFVGSLEYSRKLIYDKDFEPYEWQLEGRIGYYF